MISKRLFLFLILAGALAIILAGFAIRSSSVPQKIALTLREQGDQLQVQWGKATDTIQQITGGVLEIHDGNEVKQAKLTPEDVRNGGTLAFTPRSDDVSLRLRIDGENGQTTSQSFRFLPTLKGPQPTQELPRTGITVVNVRTPSMVRIKPPARKTFHPPVLLAMAPRTTDIEGPPVLDFNLLSPGIENRLWQPDAPPPAPVVPVQEKPKPLPPAYLPPRVLVKVVPDLGMRSVAVRNGETVEAVALIDASGNVYDVQVLHSRNVALSTKNAVITAVRQWKFFPALANGVAVRSRAPIKFTFSR